MSNLKIESARRQLGTALHLYLEDRDPVSVHCLAGGGCELIEYYAKKASGEPFTSHMLKWNPDHNIASLRRIQRQYWNAFKHATHQRSGEERQDDNLLLDFSDHQNDAALFIGWYDYAQATNSMPVEAQVHQAWYIALNPEKLAPEHDITIYRELFPNLRSQMRSQQKHMLKQVIERTRLDRLVMSDPRTDLRSLVISWPDKNV